MKKITLEIDNYLITNINVLNDLPVGLIPQLSKKVNQLKRGITVPKESVSKGFEYKKELLKLVPDLITVECYMATRKAKGGVATQRGFEMFVKECDSHEISYELAMNIVIDKGWRGFTYLWLKDEDFDKYGLKRRHPKIKTQKNISMSEVNKIISNEEKILMDKKRINTAFQDYIDNPGDKIDLPLVRYNSLVEYGEIHTGERGPKTEAYYLEKEEIAISQLISENNPENAINRNDKLVRAAETVRLKAKNSDKISFRVKELVLIDYFEAKRKDEKTVIFDL